MFMVQKSLGSFFLGYVVHVALWFLSLWTSFFLEGCFVSVSNEDGVFSRNSGSDCPDDYTCVHGNYQARGGSGKRSPPVSVEFSGP